MENYQKVDGVYRLWDCDETGGEELELDELVDFYFWLLKCKGISPQDAFFASDMDGTMFHQDLGILVFLEKLLDPEFWLFKPEEFGELLVPPVFKEALNAGARGEIVGLDKGLCVLAQQLADDIIRLYRRKKELNGKIKLDVANPIVNEFAHKMIIFDRLMMQMERSFEETTKGQLLMRIRFFDGQNTAKAIELTEQIVTNPRNLITTLAAHDENYAEGLWYQQNFRPEHELLKQQEINREVTTVWGIRRLIKALVDEQCPGRVITTNLQCIANTAVKFSDYSFMEGMWNLDRDDGTKRKPALGTLLNAKQVNRDKSHKYTKILRAGINGLPVFADQKVVAIENVLRVLRQQHNRQISLSMALGDSAGNDGPMQRAAIMNSGISVLVGDYETVRQKYAKLFAEWKKVCGARVGKRVVVVSDQ